MTPEMTDDQAVALEAKALLEEGDLSTDGAVRLMLRLVIAQSGRMGRMDARLTRVDHRMGIINATVAGLCGIGTFLAALLIKHLGG